MGNPWVASAILGKVVFREVEAVILVMLAHCPSREVRPGDPLGCHEEMSVAHSGKLRTPGERTGEETPVAEKSGLVSVADRGLICHMAREGSCQGGVGGGKLLSPSQEMWLICRLE